MYKSYIKISSHLLETIYLLYLRLCHTRSSIYRPSTVIQVLIFLLEADTDSLKEDSYYFLKGSQ